MFLFLLLTASLNECVRLIVGGWGGGVTLGGLHRLHEPGKLINLTPSQWLD